MEIFEMIITAEEARNYRHFYYELKALRFIDWVKTYIFTVSILMIIAFLTSMISPAIISVLWYKTSLTAKFIIFMVLLIFAAIQKSKSIQMSAMIQKYFNENLYQQVMLGNVKLKKVKVLSDRIQIYYKKNNDF